MASSSDDLLFLVRQLNPLRSNLTVLTKKLETFVKELGINPGDCTTLSFPQLGGPQTREPTLEGILVDNAQRLCILIVVADFVVKSLAPNERANARDLCGELYKVRDAIHFVLSSHGVEKVQEPVIQEGLEESIDDDCRCWLKSYSLKRETDGPEEVCAVRNYAICNTLSLWVDAFTRDIQYLAGLEVTPVESTTYEESVAVMCCVTITATEDEVREEEKEAINLHSKL